jgi:hypothetical protein
MRFKIALIGFGAANMLFLAYIASVSPDLLDHTAIIDPQLNGGALQNSWPHVRSNTTWQQFVDALRKFSATSTYADVAASEHPLDQPTHLHVLSKHLRRAVEPYIRRTTLFKDSVIAIEDEKPSYTLVLKNKKIQAEKIIFSPGSTPKVFNYPIPTISLSAALDSRQVECYISQGDSVILFGTAHSGCLALKNFLDAGARVSVVYATEKPFLFARDGEYDGVKQDAATIADAVLVGTLPVELIHYSNQEEVVSAALRASWACYTVGFALDDLTKTIVGVGAKYNPITARIREDCEIYGFGIAFPSCTTIDGKTFWDVSIPSFTEHILKTNILSMVSSE